MLTVTLVAGPNATDGMKISEWPSAVQVPATAGSSVGFGVLSDISAEKVTVIGAAPSTPVA
jgi:hypothetical protein